MREKSNGLCQYCWGRIDYVVEVLGNGYVRGCCPSYCSDECRHHYNERRRLSDIARDQVYKEYPLEHRSNSWDYRPPVDLEKVT